mmetsp:Transcript_63096/g.92511  ORF Transcript_63096/g.92511 Transcript_63096/m.92511 type:complete len:232 (-) Transcript_63096:600-1295(-)
MSTLRSCARCSPVSTLGVSTLFNWATSASRASSTSSLALSSASSLANSEASAAAAALAAAALAAASSFSFSPAAPSGSCPPASAASTSISSTGEAYVLLVNSAVRVADIRWRLASSRPSSASASTFHCGGKSRISSPAYLTKPETMVKSIVRASPKMALCSCSIRSRSALMSTEPSVYTPATSSSASSRSVARRRARRSLRSLSDSAVCASGVIFVKTLASFGMSSFTTST